MPDSTSPSERIISQHTEEMGSRRDSLELRLLAGILDEVAALRAEVAGAKAPAAAAAAPPPAIPREKHPARR